MLFGNRKTFAFEIRPLAPTWERRYLPERTAWAALSIWVAEINLCDHSEPGANQLVDSVNVPLAPLADWFLRVWSFIHFEERPALFAATEKPHANLAAWGEAAAGSGLDEEQWLVAREAWWKRHFIVSGTDDFFLPNLALVRDDDSMIVEWHPRRRPGGQPLWLRPGGVRIVPWIEAESAVADFITYIAKWLRNEGVGHAYEWAGWGDPLRERPIDPQGTLELYTGRTTDQLALLMGATDLRSLHHQLGLPEDMSDPAASPLTQVLRDLPPGMPTELSEPLAELREITAHSPTNQAPIALLRTEALTSARGAASAERAGYAAAEGVRRGLGLDGEPLDDVAGLLNRFGIETRQSTASLSGVQMFAGSRLGRGAAAILLQSTRTQAEWARRFEYARALGHILLDPVRGDALGAASSPYCLGAKRRRAGAFAAELLLPLSALRQLTGGELDAGVKQERFLTILNRYGIGASAAAHHLWNHRLLSSPAVRDGLIEDHSAVAG